ncbi:YMGG-like glycine zipper-containing protein [Sulfuritalea hydrogenivorans]|jgi:hypothetical protein|uniref:17 kDa surface antigen n=1 Tax=Sulfuritalea hydrogenivorans sk43H TaxID=1223802 RepID=W0SJI8_9PROT|nr:YMGG-like glycine zipper-containing protein [Sulfuritalea hydrogenivorans]MDK9715675.1 YMGG-like glycine zipper-containing protein [Sulfuritalea sp.]BAO31359.1 17 kDa surface antigen [Sulfuritalea hydrogenivorans sk43H]
MSPRNLQRPIAAAVAIAFLATSTGCATNPDGSFKKNEDGTFVIDDKAKGALIGAAAGCALASATGSDCAKGAVIGAVAGFLIGWYFESKKIASAQQVNKEYASSKTSAPPRKDVVPASFSTQVKEAPPDASGQKEIQLTSNTDMIGYGDKVPQVQQKYAIYDENNKLVEEKTEKVAAVDGAGRYQTNSKFKLPASAKGKTYTVKTALVSNNKTYKENSYKVAFADDGRVMVLAMAN